MSKKHMWEHRWTEGSCHQTPESLVPWNDDVLDYQYNIADSLWGEWHVVSTSSSEDHVFYLWRRLLIKKCDNLYHPPNPIE